MKSHRIWFTWESQRRNRELSKALHTRLFEFSEIDRMHSRLFKYVYGITKTYQTIKAEKPDIIFGQNPSIILALFLVCTKVIIKSRVIIDAHNAGIFPLEGKSKILMLISKFIQKYADYVIITNAELEKHVTANGGRAVVLPDKIPTISLAGESVKLAGEVNLLFICSWANDEPYEQVIQAAEMLPKTHSIYISGNYSKVDLEKKKIPQNVHLTGFLPINEFDNLLHSVDATIDLTDREDCLVCGAYESVAAGKPMILSDTAALRDYFYQGAVYTQHSAMAIKEAILKLAAQKEKLTDQVFELRARRNITWDEQLLALEEKLSSF